MTRVALVATRPPRRCGIAYYSQSLTAALERTSPDICLEWVPIRAPEREVPAALLSEKRCIVQGDEGSYREVAATLEADVALVQHEFGLFGRWGDHFEDHYPAFLASMNCPVVTTCHTVLPQPSPSVRQAVDELIARSERIIVMSEVAKRRLVEIYGADGSTIHVIPHGAPAYTGRSRQVCKATLGLEACSVLLMFGFLDRRKGIEFLIRALPQIVESDRSTVLLVVGTPHPDVERTEGNLYSQELLALAKELDIDHAVKFVNAAVTEDELMDYLAAADIIVTPYLSLEQVTSGTLTYALAAGRAVVSTRFAHAGEALTKERGRFVDVADVDSLAAEIIEVLTRSDLRQGIERLAASYALQTSWEIVAPETARVLRSVAASA